MKFGDKYELLESLTTGGVETFVANDKIRGERVLVHILHCDPQKPNQPTVQWVLESFRRVAPEPAALVLETGRMARQADGAVFATWGETTVLATVVAAKEAKPGQDFFPLTVHYQEKAFAAGRIPGGYLKREGRAHSLWTNPRTGEVQAVPRHIEISNNLARKICRGLSVPDPGSE